MKKNIKVLAAVIAGISIATTMYTPAFAAENSNVIAKNIALASNSLQGNKSIITLDKIIDATISNSSKLALKSKEISLYRRKMKVQEKVNDFYDDIGQTVYDFPYDKLEIQRDQTEQSEDFLRDQIANDITGKYNDIILKSIDLENAKKSLEIKNKELNMLETKATIGMATGNQLDDKEIEINSLKDDITAKENSLKNSVDYLSILSNLNLENYIFDRNVKYDVFRIDGSVDDYIDDKIEEYFKYDQDTIDISKDYFDELEDDDISDIMSEDIPSMPSKGSFISTDENGVVSFNSGNYALALIDYQAKQQKYIQTLNGYGSYIEGRYTIEEAQVKLDDGKKNLKNGMKEMYSTLLDLENKIKNLNDQMQSTKTKLKYAKSQVDIGMMTQNNYDAQVLKTKDMDKALVNLINSYNSLKDSIEKPWIINAQ